MKMNFRSAATFAAAMLALTAAGKVSASTTEEMSNMELLPGQIYEDGSYDGVYSFIENWIYDNKEGVVYIGPDSRLGADLGMDSLEMVQLTYALDEEYDDQLEDFNEYMVCVRNCVNITMSDFVWTVYSFVATER